MNRSQNSEFPLDLIGRFQDPEVLGRGGMGIIFLAHDSVLGKSVVIKTLPKGATEKQIIRFQKEAKAAAKLKHRNIITAMNFDISREGEPYLIMDYVKGETLREKLDLGSLNLTTTTYILSQVLDGLIHAQAKGVLHRDLKPSNIMLEYSKESDLPKALLIDFGIASLRKQDESGFESTDGSIKGSPAYMAPEIAKGESASVQSEVYSLGCIIFECLTGRPVFEADSSLETIEKHANSSVPDIDSLVSEDVDNLTLKSLNQLLGTCLNKNSAHRLASFEELAKALKEIEESEKYKQEVLVEEESPPTSDIDKSVSSKTKILVLGLISIVICFFVYRLLPENETKTSTSQSKKGGDLEHKKYSDSAKLADQAASGFLTKTSDKSLTKVNLDNYKNKVLRLTNPSITDSGVKLLEGKELPQIDLSYSRVTIKCLDSLKTVKGLTLLELRGIDKLDDHWIEKITKFKDISILSLDGSDITDNGIKLLSQHKKLKRLSISGCKNLTDKSIDHLTSLPDLELLSISHTDISLRAVSKLNTLEDLHAKYCQVNDNTIEYLFLLENLKTLKIEGTDITNKGLKELTKIESLHYLEVDNCKKLSESGLQAFETLRPDCKLIAW